MATLFTHGLIGSLLAPLAPRSLPRGPVVLVLLALCIGPDLDVLAFQLGIPYSHPLGHRGVTHSLAFAGLSGAVAACLFYRYVPVLSAAWFRLAALLAVATASHGVLDAFTDAGLGVGFFIPFDNDRYFFPWRPLATSPIGIASFFQDGNALQILTTEIKWVWIPSLAVTLLAYIANRLRRR